MKTDETKQKKPRKKEKTVQKKYYRRKNNAFHLSSAKCNQCDVKVFKSLKIYVVTTHTQ